MLKLLFFLQIFNGLSFLLFGAGCFLSGRAKREFVRYRMANYRVFVGVSQIVLGLLLLLSSHSKYLLFLSSTSLAVMMAVALVVRIKIGDQLFKCLPAIFYLVVSGALVASVFI